MGSVLVALVLLLNALAASPKLHELVHADAGQAAHQCATTMFAHGQMDAAGLLVLIEAPSAVAEIFPSPPVSLSSAAAETLPPGRAPPVASFPS